MILWLVVALQTARGAYKGNLFHAPCLVNLKEKDEGPSANGEGQLSC